MGSGSRSRSFDIYSVLMVRYSGDFDEALEDFRARWGEPALILVAPGTRLNYEGEVLEHPAIPTETWNFVPHGDRLAAARMDR